MNLEKVTAKWKSVMVRLAEYGIPIFILRDPFSKKPSLPFSMMAIAIVLVIVGVVGKLSKLVGGIDMPNTMQFLSTSAALYFGHSWVHKDAQGNVDEVNMKDRGNDPQ